MKKIAGDDLAGRFGAWWSGRDYVAPVEGEAGADAPKADAPEAKAQPEPQPEPKPEAKVQEPEPAVVEVSKAAKADATTSVKRAPAATSAAAGELRIKALETLWGDGRFAPGSHAIDVRMVDALLEFADQPGDIGFIGADGALLKAFAAQSDRKALVTEWRSSCVDHLKNVAPSAVVTSGEVDRPRGFSANALPAVASIEAFAYADHKAGLVGRVFRALDARGRWVFLDTTRRTKKTPPEAFASAWAEPQLATNDEIEELLKLAGFASVRKIAVTEHVLASAKHGYANLSQVLEQAAQSGFSGREGALFLQELAWEAQSWRARARALEGGALEVNLWVADKTEQLEPLELSADMLYRSIQPDDAGATEALFDGN
ncbi:MAG: hypothetical protein EON93_05480 [Burkholderiales bacterium]|nr:MAG: hypothetical protein EON93_05480 [Burkholderiales bacterium]